jgi:glycosyltransferase involved in cell wall biosynthesis
MPGSERPPENWPGWPGGKKFAFVLTHDVESKVGLNRCLSLMQLEQDLGFRSSFNFIPEGGYRVPAELREELTAKGFEVGIHDLKRDGCLFSSRRKFKRRAMRINGYARDWSAAGFRSGFILRNLDWLHDLDVQYDASTFDTDPFEPQSEGRHTIFPFWVPRPDTNHKSQITNHSGGSSPGYVELPYTLPQDSTLFLLFGEKTAGIWQRKLDWISEHGGMALFITHPDRMAFSGGSGEKAEEYPVELYKHLLEHVRSKYAGQYWQPLPREMAAFVVGLKHRPTNIRPRRVAMISHSVYMSDNRVRRYAEALATRGDHVDVFALRRNRQASRRETIEGVHLFRIQDRFDKRERSKLAYLWPLLRFFVVVSARLTVRHFKRPYDVLHIHNVPDFLVFSAWYPKLTGVPVILDIHDIVPEFFMSKFRIGTAGVTIRLLMWMERASAAFADRVIIANHLWLEKYAQRTGRNGQCTVFINHADSRVFTSIPRMRQNGKQIILYPGGLQWHQGLDIALHAFKKLSAELPTAEFHIYGDGSAKEFLVRLAADLGLDGRVRFFEPRTAREIATIMANADLGVVPKRADSFGDEAYSTKIMEFMAVGVPVVVSSTKVDRYYFNDSIVRFFESGNADALAREMLVLLRDVELRKRITAQASEYAAAHCWENRKADYLSLVDSLCASDGRDARAGYDTEDV